MAARFTEALVSKVNIIFRNTSVNLLIYENFLLYVSQKKSGSK